MFTALRRTCYVTSTTLFFGYLGSEAGESFDEACRLESMYCGDKNDFIGEKMGTISGAYVGIVMGIGIMALDHWMTSRSRQ